MTLPDDPRPGLVLCYAYLWKAEHEAGLREGRKDRPAVVVLARRDLGLATLLYVAPVTHSPPRDPAEAVEIPVAVKRRLAMDPAASFVTATEMNAFLWPGPDLRPIRRGAGAAVSCAYGYLSPGAFGALKAAIARNQRLGLVSVVRRGG